MKLRDLLADPDLGLLLLAGADQLDRPVRGRYITDLLDPRRYLHGDELVLSGLAWHDGPDSSKRFVAALADAGVAALAAGTARLGDTPNDLVDACREHGVPVLQVPVAVSFNTLADRIQHPASRADLIGAVAEGADLERVLAIAAREFDTGCWVFCPAGWIVGAGAELAEAEHRELVRRAQAGRGSGVVRVRHRRFSLFRVTTSTDADAPDAGATDAAEPVPEAAHWFVAVHGQRLDEPPSELLTAVALLRTRTEQARRLAGRSVETILHRVLDGSARPSEVVASLRAAGLSGDEPLRAAELRSGGSVTSARLLSEIAATTGVRSVVVRFAEVACALFGDAERRLVDLDERLRHIVDRLEPGLAGPLALGLSDISGVTGLRGALEEASYARRLAARRAGAVNVITGAELASHEVLLASVPDELRGTYRERVLGRIIEYDRKHHSDLLRTLRTFLECSGSWSRCAGRLHLHVNTLRYRIRRVEYITGRDLTNFAVRVDFYLALELDNPTSPER